MSIRNSFAAIGQSARVNPDAATLSRSSRMLGSTGTATVRQNAIATNLHASNQLRMTDGGHALCPMCIGVGQGIALTVERLLLITAHRSAAAGLLIAFLTFAPHLWAAEITVIASNAVKEAFLDLAPAFEKSSGHRVTVVWGGTVDISRRVAGGEVFDLVVIPAPVIDDLIQKGRLRTGSRKDFVQSPIGVAIAPGTPVPNVGSGSALRQTLLNARSIVLSSGPSSNYLLTLFQSMGIGNAIAPKVLRLAPGLSVGEALAKGEGDIGFTQVSELQGIKGIVYLGPLPPDVQHVTVFSIGVHVAAPAPEAAGSLVDYLTSPAAVPAIRHSGMEPF